MKVLFLDIDGVLNSRRTAMAYGDFPHGFSPESMARFDHVALALVRNLCRAGRVSVVLSSSWRKIHDWREVGKALDLPIIGATPRSDTGRRGEEIAAWLANHSLAGHPHIDAWAIIDDDCDMLESQRGRFVRTDGDEGLSWINFFELCEVLGVDPHACHPRAIAARG